MTVKRDPDAILAAWLEEGPTSLPEPTRRAIAVTTRTTTQRRHRFWVPRGRPLMNIYARWAVAAIAVVLAIGGAVYFLAPGGGQVGGPPTTAPSPSPSTSVTASTTPTAAASFDTSAWVAFTSTRYGYALSHPGTWSKQPADHDWSLDVDKRDPLSTAADAFRAPSNVLLFTAFAAPIPAGTSSDAWIASYFGPDSGGSPNPCQPRQENIGLVMVDGHPATIWTESETAGCGGTYGFVPVGDAMHVFVIWRNGNEPLLRAYLSTVRFVP